MQIKEKQPDAKKTDAKKSKDEADGNKGKQPDTKKTDAKKSKDEADAKKGKQPDAKKTDAKKSEDEAQKPGNEQQTNGKIHTVPIKIENGTDYSKLPYNFVDGLPVWTERTLSKEEMGPKPPLWDQAEWENHQNRRHNEIRKKKFPKLLESCRRKKERHAAMLRQKVLAEKKEREAQEEKERQERLAKQQQMENEAEERIMSQFESSWNIMEIVISDDEDAKGECGKEECVEENGKGYEAVIKMEPEETEIEEDGKGDEAVIKTEPKETEIEEDCDLHMPLGSNLEEADSETEKSEKSGESGTMQLRNKSLAAKQNELGQLSEATVKILSKPSIILVLEIFQGVKAGSKEDLEILKNPRVLQALREFDATLTVDIPDDSLAGVVPFNQNILDSIKKEGSEKRGPKRKLNTVETFAEVLKGPKKKRGKQDPEISIMQMCGSPNKGIIGTRKTSKSEMKNISGVQVDNMRKGDKFLKKHEPKSQKQISAVFDTVSLISGKILLYKVSINVDKLNNK